jgi:chromosome segregation ATPase
VFFQAESIGSLQRQLAAAHEDAARRDATMKTLKQRLRAAKVPLASSNSTVDSPCDPPALVPAASNGSSELVADLRAREKRAREVIGQLRGRFSEDQEKIAFLLLQLASVQKTAGRLEVLVDEGRESCRSLERQLRATLAEHALLAADAAAAASDAHAAQEHLLETKRHAATMAAKLAALKHLCLELEKEGAALRFELERAREEGAAVSSAPPKGLPKGHRVTCAHGDGRRPVANFKGLELMYNRVYGGKKPPQRASHSDDSDGR